MLLKIVLYCSSNLDMILPAIVKAEHEQECAVQVQSNKAGYVSLLGGTLDTKQQVVKLLPRNAGG